MGMGGNKRKISKIFEKNKTVFCYCISDYPLKFEKINWRKAIKYDGFSSLKLGIYLALLYLMGIASQPIMGIISDKMGRKIILVPSFLIMGIIFLLLSIIQNDIVLAIIIGILGAFFYPILNIAQTAIMDVANKNIQATSMGITGLISWPFILISPILAGLLVDRFNIEMAFIYAGLLALISGLIILPVKFKTLN